MVHIELLLCLSQQWECKQPQTDGIFLHSLYSEGIAQLQELLQVGAHIFIRISNLDLKVSVPGVDLGAGGHLISRGSRVLTKRLLWLAIGVDVDGTKEVGSTSVRTRWGEPKWVLALLRSDSGSSVKFGGKSKPVIHYLSSSSLDKEGNQS
jgi:hypothetical protein